MMVYIHIDVACIWHAVVQELKLVAAALFPSLMTAAARSGELELIKDLCKQVSLQLSTGQKPSVSAHHII